MTHKCPGDIFQCVFTDGNVSHLMYQTKPYAKETRRWPGIASDSKEVKQFLAIYILMGIKELPRYKDCWSPNKMIRGIIIDSVMSRNQFEWFLSHFK
jgi:hypothetical protein